MITRLSAGDRKAFDELYKRFGGRLFAVAVAVMRNRHDAEDVLQDALIKIITNADKFQKGTNGYAWMCTVVRNTALNVLAKKKNPYSTESALDIEVCIHLHADTDISQNVENSLLIEKAFAALEKTERNVVWLKYFNDLTVREIAQRTGIPRSTTADIIKKAEEKMRKILIR